MKPQDAIDLPKTKEPSKALMLFLLVCAEEGRTRLHEVTAYAKTGLPPKLLKELLALPVEEFHALYQEIVFAKLLKERTKR